MCVEWLLINDCRWYLWKDYTEADVMNMLQRTEFVMLYISVNTCFGNRNNTCQVQSICNYKTMQKIKTQLAILLAVCSFTICTAQKKSNLVLKDFESLTGSWQGSLTYLDYTSGKPYTMPADVAIKRLGKTTQFSFSNTYPKEQGANSVDTIIISNDGLYIDKELMKSRKVTGNGDVEIVTTEKGKEGNDNKPATFRYTYIIGKTRYRKTKEVQFEGETGWIKRHEYSYVRK